MSEETTSVTVEKVLTPEIESTADVLKADKQQAKIQAVELMTEFDEALRGFRNKTMGILATTLLTVLSIEFFVIFFIMSDSNVLRMQSFNGALVMCGGLAVVTLTSILLILPTKLIAYESLKLVRTTAHVTNEAKMSAERTEQRMNRTLDRFDRMVEKAEKGELPFIQKIESGVTELKLIREAVEEQKPTGKPDLKKGLSVLASPIGSRRIPIEEPAPVNGEGKA